MKMKPEHYSHIEQAVKKDDNAFHRSRYAAAGFSDTRYRWDLVRHAGLMTWICDTLYAYLNDTHIDTALRRIIPGLDSERAVYGAEDPA